MAYLPDTSVIVRLYDTNNPLNTIIRQCFRKLERDGENMVIIPQIFVEFWAVATRPIHANGLGMKPENAQKELGRLQKLLRLLPENEKIFPEWKMLVTTYKVSGKPTHDARIVAAMITHGIENILTINPGDFKRFSMINAIKPHDIY